MELLLHNVETFAKNKWIVGICVVSFATMENVDAFNKHKFYADVGDKKLKQHVEGKLYVLTNAKNNYHVGINVLFNVILVNVQKCIKALLAQKNVKKSGKIVAINVSLYAILIKNVKSLLVKHKF